MFCTAALFNSRAGLAHGGLTATCLRRRLRCLVCSREKERDFYFCAGLRVLAAWRSTNSIFPDTLPTPHHNTTTTLSCQLLISTIYIYIYISSSVQIAGSRLGGFSTKRLGLGLGVYKFQRALYQKLDVENKTPLAHTP